ncbi:hypothetical protein [Legionella sp. km772]|uniref:hypothetical protein n=1 Tax=Legionella sp. km772 TaxID=2498111 RepID=UPI000F8DAE68|nr:hypothetical protein [Legionella sp. km772]RUR07502.1 hypothetical protein ELY15_12180 [Legionella sp. km772]
MYTRIESVKSTGTLSGEDSINRLVALNECHYLTTLQGQNHIKIWKRQDDGKLQARDLYIDIPLEFLEGVEPSKKISLSEKTITTDFIVDYLASFANGLVLLKISYIPNSTHSVLCLFNPISLDATLIKTETRIEYLPFDTDHFISLLQKDRKYYLFLWDLNQAQSINTIEITKSEFSKISGAIGVSKGELILNTPKHLYFKSYPGFPILKMAKNNLKSEGRLLLTEEPLKEATLTSLMTHVTHINL